MHRLRALASAGTAFIVAAAISCHVARNPERRYHLDGVVVGVDHDGKRLTIRHGDIPGFMSAMTMAYPVSDARDLDRFHAGDHIDGDLLATDLGARLDLLAPPKASELLSRLSSAHVVVDSGRGEMVIELPSVELAAGKPGEDEPMIVLPEYGAEIPKSVAVYRAEVELRDRFDHLLPRRLLHHFNLNDPGHRELFLPIGLHILASGRETPPLEVPRLLFGLPLEQGQRLLMSAMLANPDSTPYSQVRVRLVMRYQPAGGLWPLFSGYPWVMDALFPLGHPPNGSKAFDLPPGRSEHSWEASPVIPGTIVGLGGHLHDYGVSIDMIDATSGQVIWHGVPIKDAGGQVSLMPTKVLANWHSLGVHIVPTHRYRITATYDNPTGEVIPDGGMGLVGGLFVPDHGMQWPPVDTGDTLYQQDLLATLQADSVGGREMMRMDHMMHMGGMHMEHMTR